MKAGIPGTILLILLLISCSRQNRFQQNNFDEPVQVQIHRFDLDFINPDTNKIEKKLETLALKYPEFYPYFISEILHLNIKDTLQNVGLIGNFLSDSTYIKVHQKVKSICGDLNAEEKNLSTAFSYLHYYFPEIKLPSIYAFTSGFNQQIISNDSIIAFGTDFYLGSDFDLYPEVSHEYLIKNFRREMIEVNILNEVLHQQFKYGNVPVNLLGSMLYEGKIMYLMETFLSEKSEENLIGFTTAENDWFKKHQKHIWTLLLEQKYLFTSDYTLISKFIQVAPFTSPVSQESPGQLGIRLGWEIIRSYMENNQEITLPELMKNTRYQTILEQSKYRP